MSIKTKNAGAYADIVGVFHKRAGAYEAVQGVYTKAGGAYGRVDAPAAQTFEIFRLHIESWYNGGASGGTAGSPRVADMQLLIGATAYPVPIMTADNAPSPLVASASATTVGSPFSAFDKNLSDTNRWIGGSGTKQWIEINLGAGNGITPDSIKIAPDGAAPAYSLQRFILTGRNNGQTPEQATGLYYADLSSSTGWTASTLRTFTLTPILPAPSAGTPSRYWRIVVTDVDGGTFASAAEFQFYASTDGTGTNLALAKFAFQSGDDAIGPAINAVDGSTSTEAGSAFTAPGPFVWGVDLGSAAVVQSFAIVAQRITPNRTPKAFSVQCSLDGGNWTTVKTVTAQTGWTELQRRVFSLT